MLVENQYVDIGWCGRNVVHLLNRGYSPPVGSGKGRKVRVKAEDLMDNSGAKVLLRCDTCKEESNVTYEKYISRYKDFYECYCCNKKRTASTRLLWNYDMQKEYIESKGCKVISTKEEFENRHVKHIKPSLIKIKIICSCGNNEFIRDFRHFYSRNQQVCYDCALEKNRGENNKRYNHNLTDEHRQTTRNLPQYKDWRDSVFLRDNFTCQCCGDQTGGNLNAHHLDGYNWCKERRLDISNGITLCEKCHDKFHMSRGYGDNTYKQFMDWISTMIPDWSYDKYIASVV